MWLPVSLYLCDMPSKKEIEKIVGLAHQYNNPIYFQEDPIIFPKHFAQLMQNGNSQFSLPYDISYKVSLKDVEIVAIISAHLAWGRRDMIVRDITRAMDEMNWKPYLYIKSGNYRSDQASLHRTIKWSEFAKICNNLNQFFSNNESLQNFTPDQIRVKIYGQKSNPKMANKKIHMLRRWMVRDDGIVDIGLWKNIDKNDLIIPLDTHVHSNAISLGITKRKSADIITAEEITSFLRAIFPGDPCLGDFALFAYSATNKQRIE